MVCQIMLKPISKKWKVLLNEDAYLEDLGLVYSYSQAEFAGV